MVVKHYSKWKCPLVAKKVFRTTNAVTAQFIPIFTFYAVRVFIVATGFTADE